MIKAAILGYGTVGSGVFQVLRENREQIVEKNGCEIEVKYVLDLREFPQDPVEEVLVHDFNVIANDPEVSIVCETMGGVKPAYDFTKKCLEAGKSVCTSNKELVEKHGAELIALAKEHDCNYLFEASVGGGIPILRPMINALSQEKIVSITGILNGTTNYILSKMEKEGADFDEVLKQAQELGYAERNPEADVCGHDACRKIAILTSLAYGRNCCYEDIYTEGITNISVADFTYAHQLGGTIKLFGKSYCKDGKYYALVAPFVVTQENPLANVHDVYNAILVKGNMVGSVMFYGKGAGKLATASAVVSDVIECAKHVGKNIMITWKEEKLPVSSSSQARSKFLVRVSTRDKKEIKAAFGAVSFLESSDASESGFVTEKMTLQQFEDISSKFGKVISRIRVN